MKYRGNKALMKCCKSCINKKRIRCLGTPRIYKYKGYKFCIECTRPKKIIEKRLESLNLKRNLELKNSNKNITSKDTNITKEYHMYIQRKSSIDIEEIIQYKIIKKYGIITILKKFLNRVVRAFGNKIQKTYQ